MKSVLIKICFLIKINARAPWRFARYIHFSFLYGRTKAMDYDAAKPPDHSSEGFVVIDL